MGLYVYVCVCKHMPQCVWRSEDNAMESVLAIYHVGSEKSAHVIRLAQRATSPAVLHFFSKLKHFRKKNQTLKQNKPQFISS